MHDHHHSSGHAHPIPHALGRPHQAGAGERRGIKAAFFLTVLIAVVEAAGGLLTGSMALLSDAMHMLTDVTGLAISFLASKLSALAPDDRRSFGYRRVEVVAALANALLLWLVSGYMLREVYERFLAPVTVLSAPMMIVAFIGLAANIISARLLLAHKDANINIRAAFLHVVSDMAGSVGVIIAGAVIYFTGYYRMDTLVSVAIIALILYSSTRLMLETFHILLEGTPTGMDLKEVRLALAGIPGVDAVHELHVWSLTAGFNAISAHLVVKEKSLFERVLKDATCAVACRFEIKHCAFQVESEPVENSSCDVCVH
ncbi:MAG: cation diffusion facilitator family transporter [Elusimicrobiales bacterium]|jgi:cobalt-zinc-cadmium efflux system protein